MLAAAGATSRKCEYFIDSYGEGKNFSCGIFWLTVQEVAEEVCPAE
jgi:hypothetical protein